MAEKKDPIRSLIDTGRRAGKLTSSEITDAMEENGTVLDVEAMEKLYEELAMEEEMQNRQRTANKKIFVTQPVEIDKDRFAAMLEDLANITPENVRTVLMRYVPNYHPAPPEQGNTHKGN